MPELPDVAVYKKLLDTTSMNKPIRHISVSDKRIFKEVSVRRFSRVVTGNLFERSMQHGKYLLVQVSGKSPFVLFHFGMTGALSFLEKKERAPAYTRCVFGFTDGTRLAVTSQRLLGRIGLADDPRTFVREKGLGPHPLGHELDEDSFVRILSARRGMIKTALMDQAVVAGIGNIYADEILYQTGIHPESDLRSLDPKKLGDLFRIMRRVLQTAIDHDADPEKMPKSFLLPSRRSGAHCPQCKGKIEKTRVGGRGTYLCPSCQKEGGG